MQAEDFVIAYEASLASQDWKNVAPLLHENSCVTFSNGVVHEGKQKVKTAFEHNFSAIENEAYHMSNIRWLLKTEATAVYLFEFAWKGSIKGELVQGQGVGTAVLVQADGKWLLLGQFETSIGLMDKAVDYYKNGKFRVDNYTETMDKIYLIDILEEQKTLTKTGQ